MYNGKIYVFGGINNGAEVNSIEVFDPATNVWSTLSTTGKYTPRDGLTSVVLNGMIYVIGGEVTGNLTNIVEILDPLSQKWSTPQTTGNFIPHEDHISNLVNGKIYVIGGVNTQTPPPNMNYVFTPTKNDVKFGSTPADINIFPNPSSGMISVSKSSENISQITVTNILGEKVLEITNPYSPTLTIDLSKQPSGIYYAKFITSNSVVVKKILLQ